MKKVFLLFIALCCSVVVWAQVSKPVNLTTAGTLNTVLTTTELTSVTNLILTGSIDARDFKTMRDKMTALASLDLSGATIVAYTGTLGTNGTTSQTYAANTIPASAFNWSYNNSLKLQNITLGNSITSIENRAFYLCTTLTKITFPNALASIGDWAFQQTSIPSFTIPASVSSIGVGVFAWCSTAITVAAANPYFVCVDGVLYDKAQEKILYCPTSKTGSFIVPNTVKEIGAGSFAKCTLLTSVTLPKTVSLIQDYAFQDINNLTVYVYNPAVIGGGSVPFHRATSVTAYVPVGSKSAYQTNAVWNALTLKEMDIANNPTNKALDFDGVNDYVLASAPTTATTNVTLEAWVNCSASTGANQMILLNGNSSYSGYALFINSSRVLCGLLGGVQGFASSYTVELNTWHHYALVCSANVWTIYVDGVAKGSISNTPAIPIGGFYLGKSQAGEFFKGKMDEVRFWNIARSSADIQANMYNSIPNPESNSSLVAYYKFDQGVANGINTNITTLTDASKNKYNGTLNNFTLAGTNSNFVPRNGLLAYYPLDGNANDYSGNNNTAILYNKPTPAADRTGATDKAYTFNGINQYAEIPAAVLSNRNKFSVSLWINSSESRVNSTTQLWHNPTIMGNATPNGLSQDWQMLSKSGKLGLYEGLSTQTDNYKYSDFSINDSKWHSIVVTYDGSILKEYLDNCMVASISGLDKSTNGVSNFLMALNDLGVANDFHQGTLDDVRIYDSPLSVDDIKDLNRETMPTLSVSTTNNALAFDGKDDYVSLSIPPLDDFTIEYWMKTNMTASTGEWYQGAGLVDADMGGNSNDFGTSLVGTKLAFGIGSPNTWKTITSVSDVSTGNWVHVAVTWKRSLSKMELYVNGSLENSAFFSSPSVRSSKLMNIGRVTTAGYYSGQLDEVRIWSTARTQAEIVATMNASIATKTGNLLINYTFDKGIANGANTTTLLDESGNTSTFNGTLTTMALSAGNTTSNYTYGAPLTYPNTATLSLAKTKGSSGVARVTSTTTWTATSDATWLTLSPSTATGNGLITISTQTANPTSVERTAKVTLSAVGTTPQTIAVTQAAGDATLSVSTTNNALAFDGGLDYIVTQSPISSDFTIEYWMKTTQTNVAGGGNWYNGIGIVDAEVSGATQDFGTALFGNKLSFGLGLPDISVSSKTAVNTGQWMHVAASWNQASGKMKLYINGACEDSVIGSTLPRTATSLVLGAMQTGTSYFNGQLDEVRIWKTARVQDSIIANMYKSIRSRNDLQLSYTFNQGIANGNNSTVKTVIDSSGNNKNGSLSGNFTLNGNTSNWTTGAPLQYTAAANLKIAKEASTNYATVTSNTAWTATETVDWLSISPSTTTGNGVLTISAIANPTIKERTATIAVTPQTITVTQAAGDATLSIPTTSYNVPKEATTTKLTVVSNASIKATNSDSWLQVDVSGLNVSITALANTTSASRTATVTIYTTTGSPKQTQTITINQAAGNATLEVVSSQSVAYSAATTTVTITSNAAWTATAAANDWLTITTASGTNNGSLLFTSATNTTVDARSATISIRAKGEVDSMTKTVVVTQEAGVPSLGLSKKSHLLDKVKTDTAKVSVASNTSWTATSSEPTWLTVSPSGATGSGTLMFTAQTNTTTSERSAKVFLVTTKGNPVVKDTIFITQAKGDSTLTIEKDAISIGKSIDSKVAVKVNANFAWEKFLPANGSWLSFARSGDSLVATATELNGSASTRDALIHLIAGTLKDSVRITQLNSDPYLSITDKTVLLNNTGETAEVKIVANEDWTVSEDASWLSAIWQKNANDTVVAISAIKNLTIQSRTASILITPKTGNPQTITVTQAAGDATLSLSRNTASVEKVSDILHINVLSNTAWSLESSASWLTIDTTTGNDTALRVLSVAANNTVIGRSATLTAKAVGATDVTFTLSQAAGDTIFSITPDDTVPSIGGIQVIPVKSNVGWVVFKNPSWVTILESSDSTKIEYVAEPNTTIFDRVDTIKVKRSPVSRLIIIVTQLASDTLLSIAQTGLNVSKAGGVIKIAVESNDSSWNVSKQNDWLTASKNKTKDSLIITVDTNKTILSRVDTLWVKAGTKRVAVVLTQAKGDAYLLVNKTTVTETDTVLVAANIAWTVTESADWLSVTINDTQVSFTDATNPTVSERSATISFISIDSTITRFVSFIQAAGDSTLSMKETALLFDKKASTDTLIINTNTQPHIKNLPTWISAKQSDSLLLVSVQQNTATIARQDSFTVSVQGITKTIVVEQAAGDTVFSVSASVNKYAANAQLTDSLVVTSNASLQAKTNATWLQISFDGKDYKKLSTLSLHNITQQQVWIKADTNKTLDSRKDTVFISSGSLKKAIVVEQDAAIKISPIKDTTMFLDKISKDYVFADIFKYTKKDSINYNVSFSLPSIVNYISVKSIADKDSAFGLSSRKIGTTKVIVKAKTTWGTLAETSFNVTVKNCTGITIDSVITPIVCAGDSTGRIMVKASGGAKPYSYIWSNNNTNDTVRNLATGNYTVTVIDSLGCSVQKTYIVPQTNPIKITENITSPSMCDAADGAITLAVSGGNGSYQYKWNDGSVQSTLTNKKNGDYVVTVTDITSCKVSKSIHISDKNAPTITVNSIKPSLCKKATGSIDISVANSNYTVLWSNASTEEDQVNVSPATYWVKTLSGTCKDSISITVPSNSISQPDLSLVTLDSTFTHNLVVWMREQTETIDYYHIYRDSVLIDSVPYNQISVYKDTSSLVKPFKQSYTYQISASNTCGGRTLPSIGFKTIHLQAYRALDNSANELRWEDYGGSVRSRRYIVYRKDGSSWKKIDSLINGIGYTDKIRDKAQYYVAIDLPFEVRPTLFKTDTGPFSQSLSNVSEASLVDLHDTKKADDTEVSLVPNPTNSQVTISFGDLKTARVSVTDLLGHQLMSIEGTTSVTIDCSAYTPGMYLVNVTINGETTTHRLVIE